MMLIRTLAGEHIVGREAIKAPVAGHKLVEDDVLMFGPLPMGSSSSRETRSSRPSTSSSRRRVLAQKTGGRTLGRSRRRRQ
jgi:hypothetical protein